MLCFNFLDLSRIYFWYRDAMKLIENFHKTQTIAAHHIRILVHCSENWLYPKNSHLAGCYIVKKLRSPLGLCFGVLQSHRLSYSLPECQWRSVLRRFCAMYIQWKIMSLVKFNSEATSVIHTIEMFTDSLENNNSIWKRSLRDGKKWWNYILKSNRSSS